MGEINLTYNRWGGGGVENFVGNGENAGFPAFSPCPTMFSTGPFFFRVIKIRDCVVKG